MKLVKKNSPNHFNGRKGWKADIIVFHQTGGNTLAPALNYYLNPCAECSPNYLIDTDGMIYQLVDIENAAWCNGTAIDPSDKKYYGYSLSSIVRDRKTNANLFSISAEFVHCQWGNITEAQKTAAVDLIQQIIIPYMKKNGVTPQIDRNHIIGHSDVTPKTRDPEKYNCPGKYFPYDEIISRVNGIEEEIDPTTTHEDVQYIYKAVSSAAVRSGMSKSTKIYSRVTNGDYYTIDRIYKVNGVTWLRHAGQEAYSMLNDGGALFRKTAVYSTKRTTHKVNIRATASVKGEIIDTLPIKTIVYMWAGEPPALVDGYYWAKIIYEGKICYIASEYLK